MKCEMAQENILLAIYGELPDEFAGALEQHLAGCEDCRREWNAMRILEERLALLPVMEPSPNLVAQARMRLDDALDLIPPHGFLTRLRSNFFAWIGHVQSAPALATLLLGVGFLAGNFTYRYQVAHAPKQIQAPVRLSNPAEGSIANVTGIVQTPNSELVQVKYNRMVPESMEGLQQYVGQDPRVRDAIAEALSRDPSAEVRKEAIATLGPVKTDSTVRQVLRTVSTQDENPYIRTASFNALQGAADI